jgi:hypothetical protein
MFEDSFQNLRGMLQATVQSAALVIAIVLFCGSPAIAISPAPAANQQAEVLDWSIEQRLTETEPGTAQIKFLHDEQRNHVWIARIASLELRLEWGSGHGRNIWSVTILDTEGKQVAHAEAIAETDKCI